MSGAVQEIAEDVRIQMFCAVPVFGATEHRWLKDRMTFSNVSMVGNIAETQKGAFLLRARSFSCDTDGDAEQLFGMSLDS